MSEKRRILVGITGGIAAYKVPQLIRLLKKQGADVKIVCTPSAFRFVGDETLRTVSGHPPYRDGVSYYDIEHIRLAEWADTFLICPASANTIAKIACGIADNLLTSVALSLPPERLAVAPAMNTVMWENEATKENIALLKKRGAHVFPVGEGELACSGSGAGRMIEIEEIADFVMPGAAAGGLLKGKTVVISSGPTEEPIDPVRVITNRSSGKMGAALARAALMHGAAVTVVSGPAGEPLPLGAHVVRVSTASEMHAAMAAEFKSADIGIMAAAVSDFKPVRYSKTKLRREGNKRLSLELESNPDILAELGKRKGKKFLVGFALETEQGDAMAKRKMRDKKCDMMVLNRAGEALSLDTTKIAILHDDGRVEKCPAMKKSEAGELIVRRIAARLGLTNE